MKKLFFALFVPAFLLCGLLSCETDVILSNENKIISFSIDELSGVKFTIDKDGTIKPANKIAHHFANTLKNEVTVKFEISKKASLNITGKKIASGAKVRFTKINDKKSYKLEVKVIAEDKTATTYQIEIDLKDSDEKNILTASVTELSGVSFAISGNEVKPASPIAYSKKSILEADITLNYTISPKATLKIGSSTVASGSKVRLVKNTANKKLYELAVKIIAEDGSEKDYTIKTTLSSNDAKNILTASVTELSGVSFAVSGDEVKPANPIAYNKKNILEADITLNYTISAGAMLKIGGNNVASGSKVSLTKNSSNPKIYELPLKIVAEDSSTKDYILKITLGNSSEKNILSLSLGELSGVSFAVSGDEVKPANEIPYNNKNKLEADVTLNYNISEGATLKIGGNSVASGSKIRLVKNSANPKIYEKTLEITAEDRSKKSYVLSVKLASAGKDILTLSISELTGVSFTINGNEVKNKTKIPYANKNKLEADVTLNYTISAGATLKIGSNTVASGSKIRLVKNSSDPKLYERALKVTATDGKELTYTLKVERASNEANELLSFGFNAADNAGISTNMTGSISGENVTFSAPIPTGADLKNLIPTFAVSEGATVYKGTTKIVSGVAKINFIGKVVLKVVAESGKTKSYTIDTEKVISEELSVTNKGATMKVQMHGTTKSKKLLLVVHGGPGGNSHSYHFSKSFRDNVETKYVVAYWDQRGCGMSVDGGGSSDSELTIANYVSDMDAVVGELKREYPNYKIFIYSSSWGGMITPAFLAEGSNKNDISGWVSAEGNHNTPLSRKLHVQMLIREADIEIAAGRDSDEYDGRLEDGKDGKNDWATWKKYAENVDLSDFDITKAYYFYQMGETAEKKKRDALINAGTINPDLPDSKYPHTPLHPTDSSGDKYDSSPNVLQAMIKEVMLASQANKLNQITIPVRIFYGKWDFITSAGMAEELYNKLGSTDKQKIEFSDSGHGMSDHEPTKFIRELTKFIDSK